MRRTLLTTLVAASATLTQAAAYGYTIRKSDAGEPVRWADSRVEVVIDASVGEVDPHAADTVAKAMGEWSGVDKSFAPDVVVSDGKADEVGYHKGAKNMNTVRYAKEGSPIAGKALGVTVLTYDSTGKVLDADIIMNGGAARDFALLGEKEGYDHGGDHSKDKLPSPKAAKFFDFQNVLTHEAGHFLGFGENNDDKEATMFFSSARGEINKRNLNADDVAGVQDLYADAGSSASESPASAGASCSVRSGVPLRGSSWFWFLAAGGSLALLGGAASRQKRRPIWATAASVAMAAAIVPPGVIAKAPTQNISEVAHEAGVQLPPAAFAVVTGHNSQWEDGLIVTTLQYQIEESSPGSIPPPSVGKQDAVQMLGGTVDGITQVVGHSLVPPPGTRVPLEWDGDKLAFPKDLPIRSLASFPTRTPGEKDVQTPVSMSSLKAPTGKADARRVAERLDVEVEVTVEDHRDTVSADVTASSDHNFFMGFSENISEGGLFIATHRPKKVGELVDLEFTLPGVAQKVKAVGEVRWTRVYAESNDAPPGMGVRFVEMSEEDAAAIRAFVQRRSPIFWD